MTKRVVLVLMICSLLALSGCITDTQPAATALPPLTQTQVQSREELYELYNQIDFNMTTADLEAKLGPASREEVSMEESTGVTLSWERNGVYTRAAFSDGQMIGKAIEVNDPRVMALLTPVTDFDALHTIERDMNYTQIVEIMGCEGLEIMARINREESPITVSRLMCWIDSSGSIMQILFNQDGTISDEDNSSMLYEFPTLAPGATYAPTPTVDPSASPRPTAILTEAPAESAMVAATEVPAESATAAITEAPTGESTAASGDEAAAAPTEAATADATATDAPAPAA